MKLGKIANSVKNISLIIAISIVYLLPIFLGGMFLSHDSITHTVRSAMYANAITHGQIIPRWAESANYGFGSPFFIFFYPLSGYIIAIFHLVGFPLEISFLLITVISFMLGAVFFYIWIKKLLGDDKIAFSSSIFFMILPYRFLTIYVRGGVGELLSFSLLPLIFYYVEKFNDKKDFQAVLPSSIAYALMILSHNGIGLTFTPIIFLYSFFRKTSVKTLVSMSLGLLLTAFFWIPSLIEANYTNGLFYFGSMYKDHFAPLLNFVYSSWGFGPNVNKVGGLSPQIGIFAFFTILTVVYLLIKHKLQKEKKMVVFWLLCFTIGLFMATSYSGVLWQHSDFLKKFQFPWRFIAVPSFASAALFPYVLKNIKDRRATFILVAFLLLFSLQFARVSKIVHYPDSFYYNYEGSTSFHNEATTIWSAGDPAKKEKYQIELIGGKADVGSVIKKSILHSFKIDAKTPAIILDNTVYFPGWEVYMDNVKTQIQYQDPSNKGLITFNVPQGKHNIEVKFVETKLRLFSDILSILGLAMLVLTGVVLRKQNK